MGKAFHHLTYEQRIQIKEMLEKGYKKTEIAEIFGIHHATIYREIKRGSINGQYDPNHSESAYQAQLSKKGTKPILSIEPELSDYIAKLILIEKLNPSQIITRLQNDNRFKSVPKSRNTIYNAIDGGLIPGVTRENLNSDTTTVFNDGQIHLARWVRDTLNIQDGDTLYFEIVDGKLVFQKYSK